MLRIVAEGMEAYYNRDSIALRKLLERIEEQRPRLGARDAQVLEQIVNGWIRATRGGTHDATRSL
jgi:hypothetical protein